MAGLFYNRNFLLTKFVCKKLFVIFTLISTGKRQ